MIEGDSRREGENDGGRRNGEVEATGPSRIRDNVVRVGVQQCTGAAARLERMNDVLSTGHAQISRQAMS